MPSQTSAPQERSSGASTDATMKRIVVHKLTSDFEKAIRIENFQLEDLEKGLKDGSVIVKVTHLGINASDTNFTAGRYDPTVVPPFGAGFEAIGHVFKSTESAATSGFQVGQAVGLMTFGAFSEYLLVPCQVLIPLPAADPVYFGAMVSGLTAVLSLPPSSLTRGKTILITAAAGGAGQMAVQWAKHHGLHVIGTCSSPEKASLLKGLGCDRVVNYRKEDLKQVLKKEYKRGIDLVFESVGGEMLNTCIDSLAVRGELVVIGWISSYLSDVQGEGGAMKWDTVATTTLLKKSLVLRGFFLNNYQEEIPEAAMELIHLIKAGKIKVAVDAEFHGIEEVPKAVAYLHSGKNIGKVVACLDTGVAKL